MTDLQRHHTRLGLSETAHWRAFSQFADQAREATASLEWSVKAVDATPAAPHPAYRLQRDRHVWAARPDSAMAWQPHLRALPLAPGLQQVIEAATPGAWNLLVAWDGTHDRLKVYLTHPTTPTGDWFSPTWGAHGPPPGQPTLVAAWCSDRPPHPTRTYLFWNQADWSPAVTAWVTSVAGPRWTALLSAHPRSGLVFKTDGSSMAAAAFQPTGIDTTGHAAHRFSPLLGPVRHLAAQHPDIAGHLSGLTWVDARLDGRSPLRPSELNLYFRLS